MKIKVTTRIPGYIDRDVSVIAINGQSIPLGIAYYRKNSGWHGGGQSWIFRPNDDLLALRIGEMPTRSKMIATLKNVLSDYIGRHNPADQLTEASPIIMGNIPTLDG